MYNGHRNVIELGQTFVVLELLRLTHMLHVDLREGLLRLRRHFAAVLLCLTESAAHLAFPARGAPLAATERRHLRFEFN